eukprot:6137328-Pyramimonas_sp.AAC.2
MWEVLNGPSVTPIAETAAHFAPSLMEAPTSPLAPRDNTIIQSPCRDFPARQEPPLFDPNRGQVGSGGERGAVLVRCRRRPEPALEIVAEI